LCGFIATVENGKVTDLTPDVTRYPYDERVAAGCQRWQMNLDFLDDPKRVNYPLKRDGERGCGKWQRISWDTALDEISEKLESLRQKHGAGTLASMIGGPHTSFWPLHKFMTLFGSPNNMGIGQICWNPRIWMDVITFGWTIEADITDETECVFIWGTNPAESDNSVFWRTLLKIGKSDVPLCVVDPRFTRTARAADIWVAPRPGTDCALLLGMLNVIIAEGLYDHQFVDEWCHGFDELAALVAAWTPERASRETGVDAAQIIQIARLFANAKAAALISGRGIDQVGASVSPTHRAICCLRAITGNIDTPGSCIILESSDFVEEVDLECTLEHARELDALCLNTPHTPLQCYAGYSKFEAQTTKLGRRLPARYLTSAHPDLVLTAMETGKPYRVSALIVEATNPLLTYADTHRVYNALMGLDLLVVLDYYITPTAAIADYVLPAAGAIERPTFQAHGGVANIAYGGAAAVVPYYERKCDYEIFRLLGERLGQKDAWSDATFEDAIERTLEPCGMTWDEYEQRGLYARIPNYYKHLILDDEGAPAGFATPTGKIELASETLDALGGPRLPEPGTPRRLCTEAFVKEYEQAGWTHIELITGARKQPYNASMYMNNAQFRRRYPAPVAEMSEATARKLGLAAGDCVTLAANNGQATFVLDTIQMVDGVVSADYGWWHPENNIEAPDFGGIWESNINCLTSCSLDQSEKMIGTWSYNAIDCMIKKADKPISWVLSQ
jgi:anaerobic selenocysteine-containing dehydrogenase